MQRMAMSVALIRRVRQSSYALVALAFLPYWCIAQDSDQLFHGHGELLTMLTQDRIALPIGDGAQKLEVSVFVPHNYDPAQSYPLLVVLDADPLLGLLKTINFVWVEEGKSVPVILVGLPFGSSAAEIWANRSYYLLPNRVGIVEYYGNEIPLNNGGGASHLAKLIQDEVLPHVFDEYSVDSNRIGLAAFSMGGLFAAWHMVTYPDVFTDYLIIAPPLAPPFVDSSFAAGTHQLQRHGFSRPTRLYLAYAESDLEYVLSGASSWVAGWRKFEGTNLSLHAEVFKDHRHDAGAIPALINGYEFLYER